MATSPQGGAQGGWTNTTKPHNTGMMDAYNGFMQGRNMNDPALQTQFNNLWNTAKANGTQFNAGTPPAAPAATPPTTAPTATGVAPPTGAATSVDPVMGASYMPLQPDATAMAGAAVQPIQQAAPPKPATKKPATTASTTPAGPKGPQYKLPDYSHLRGKIGPQYLTRMQQITDNYMKTGNNDPVAFMSARDALARVANEGMQRRHGGGGGYAGGTAGNYGSSGPSSGGGRLA